MFAALIAAFSSIAHAQTPTYKIPIRVTINGKTSTQYAVLDPSVQIVQSGSTYTIKAVAAPPPVVPFSANDEFILATATNGFVAKCAPFDMFLNGMKQTPSSSGAADYSVAADGLTVTFTTSANIVGPQAGDTVSIQYRCHP